MATRRRRPSTTQSNPEPTHEEMLEVAAEREAEVQAEETPEEEEKAIEVFLAMAAADTFEALQKAEEEKGVADFFDPGFYKQEVRHPAKETGYIPPTVHTAAAPKPQHKVARVARGRRGSDRRG